MLTRHLVVTSRSDDVAHHYTTMMALSDDEDFQNQPKVGSF